MCATKGDPPLIISGHLIRKALHNLIDLISEFILNRFMYFLNSVTETRVRGGKDSALRMFEMKCCVRFIVSILDKANKALMS